jgi:hypothetical protein
MDISRFSDYLPFTYQTPLCQNLDDRGLDTNTVLLVTINTASF